MFSIPGLPITNIFFLFSPNCTSLFLCWLCVTKWKLDNLELSDELIHHLSHCCFTTTNVIMVFCKKLTYEIAKISNLSPKTI